MNSRNTNCTKPDTELKKHKLNSRSSRNTNSTQEAQKHKLRYGELPFGIRLGHHPPTEGHLARPSQTHTSPNSKHERNFFGAAWQRKMRAPLCKRPPHQGLLSNPQSHSPRSPLRVGHASLPAQAQASGRRLLGSSSTGSTLLVEDSGRFADLLQRRNCNG